MLKDWASQNMPARRQPRGRTVITYYRILTCVASPQGYRKIFWSVETVIMAMIEPNPRQKPDAHPGGILPASAIDWSRVLAEHDRWLRTVVYARLGEPQAIDEVMQEVSFAAVRQKAPINDPQKVAAWLYRLAVTQTLLYRARRAGSESWSIALRGNVIPAKKTTGRPIL